MKSTSSVMYTIHLIEINKLYDKTNWNMYAYYFS